MGEGIFGIHFQRFAIIPFRLAPIPRIEVHRAEIDRGSGRCAINLRGAFGTPPQSAASERRSAPSSRAFSEPVLGFAARFMFLAGARLLCGRLLRKRITAS